jgi:hypothetical protein
MSEKQIYFLETLLRMPPVYPPRDADEILPPLLEGSKLMGPVVTTPFDPFL